MTSNPTQQKSNKRSRQSDRIRNKSEDSEHNQEYQIEKILKKKVKNEQNLYYVKWVGSDEKTWEPDANFNTQESKQMLKDYDRYQELIKDKKVGKFQDKRIRIETIEILDPEKESTSDNLICLVRWRIDKTSKDNFKIDYRYERYSYLKEKHSEYLIQYLESVVQTH